MFMIIKNDHDQLPDIQVNCIEIIEFQCINISVIVTVLLEYTSTTTLWMLFSTSLIKGGKENSVAHQDSFSDFPKVSVSSNFSIILCTHTRPGTRLYQTGVSNF